MMTDADDGLVSREIVTQTDTYIIIREVWDSKHPGCPFILYPSARSAAEAPRAEGVTPKPQNRGERRG